MFDEFVLAAVFEKFELEGPLVLLETVIEELMVDSANSSLFVCSVLLCSKLTRRREISTGTVVSAIALEFSLRPGSPSLL